MAGAVAAEPAAARRPTRSGVVNALLVVGVLVALAVPSYLGHVERRDSQRVEASLSRASLDAETYYASRGTYVGVGDPKRGLWLVDPGLGGGITAVVATDERYCLKGVEGRATAWIEGPGGAPTNQKPSDCA